MDLAKHYLMDLESSRAKIVKLNELDSSSAEKGMMVKLNELYLLKTEIREISFPEGVCPNLRSLYISCCSDLVQVGALPVTLRGMELTSCKALRKIGGLDGLVELHTLVVAGCPIEEDELKKWKIKTFPRKSVMQGR